MGDFDQRLDPPPELPCGQYGLTLLQAISEHQRQSDVIRHLQAHAATQQAEIEVLKRELHDRMHRGPPQQAVDPYAQDQYGRQRQPELPPLRALQSPTAPVGPESMTGVQYEPARVNGYRPGEPPRF
jgi:hypothetical protein